jgi:hypothetical protein
MRKMTETVQMVVQTTFFQMLRAIPNMLAYALDPQDHRIKHRQYCMHISLSQSELRSSTNSPKEKQYRAIIDKRTPIKKDPYVHVTTQTYHKTAQHPWEPAQMASLTAHWLKPLPHTVPWPRL